MIILLVWLPNNTTPPFKPPLIINRLINVSIPENPIFIAVSVGAKITAHPQLSPISIWKLRRENLWLLLAKLEVANLRCCLQF